MTVCKGTTLQTAGSCCAGSGSVEANTSGCCDNTAPTTPLPTDNCGAPCPESHCLEIITNRYALAVKVLNGWNVPACGETAVLLGDAVTLVHIGSYLWSEAYGYYEIVGFNATTSEITVQNNCHDSNSPPGTAIPECSTFIVTDPPIDIPGPDEVCVAVDFTAPANGACLVITLTTTAGITAGDFVVIGSGEYRVASVSSATLIEICNDGDGITPGTAVIALNANGDYQYCLVIISADPCSLDPEEDAATLLGCTKTDGYVRKITGGAAGQVFVLIDDATGVGEFVTVPNASQSADSVDFVDDVLDSGTTTLTGNTAAVTFTNTSNTKSMIIQFVYIYKLAGSVQGANTDTLSVTHRMERDIDGGGYAVVRSLRKAYFMKTDAAHLLDEAIAYTAMRTLAPGASTTHTIRASVTWQGAGSAAYNVTDLNSQIGAHGVAV